MASKDLKARQRFSEGVPTGYGGGQATVLIHSAVYIHTYLRAQLPEVQCDLLSTLLLIFGTTLHTSDMASVYVMYEDTTF